ncbi:MAG TPA: dephospho-CoA kinase [Candidatus Angelobacter sp.]|nr:dephospho-CoA kinase [Candidatus Angelobacter sp.]
MLHVGLTGGVACGKSTVSRMFAELGAQVIDADRIVHELYRRGEPVYQQLVAKFGEGILAADGEIDRGRLATLAFDDGHVQELNRIVHPAVGQKQKEWIEEAGRRQPNGIALVEATLTLEAGGKARYDKIVVVICKPEQKVLRYAMRAHCSEAIAREEVDRRTKVQMTDIQKAALADYVIDNSGTLEQTRRQVENIYKELQTLASHPAR